MAYTKPDYKAINDPWESSDINTQIDNVDLVYSGGFTAEHLYNSDFFAVTYGTTYTKAHGLGKHPRLVVLQWCSTNTPTAGTEIIPVTLVRNTTAGDVNSPLGYDDTNIYITTGSSTTAGTISSTRANSGGGYYRILAWAGQ